ncbi:metal ABC transporter solute-binding protein, Zn/Mn family [Porphyromonas sp. COT-108 OH2963]|uniref:metal ABC transporter solute-binding protein, Zn/Mn family n=2 Tax=Porphyromonas TaxID=836 RepID=UPI0009DEE478|nr:zinc ABC transporter substrate-binding protein [Porphyromonas sp. COT-108 OH2963]
MLMQKLIVSKIFQHTLGVILILSCLSCTSNDKTDSKPEIVVSISPQRFFAEKLLGDIANVRVLVPPGANPESFDPTPNTLLSLSSCKVFFYMGSLLMEKTLVNTINENGIKSVDLSNYVPKEIMEAYGSDHICSHPGHVHSSMGDPHYWSSILGGRAIAKGMFETFQAIFPKHKDLLEKNYDQLIHEMDLLEKEIELLKSNSSTRSFVIFHPSLSFFSGEWGLSQIAVEHEGKEPTPKHIEKILKEAKDQDARAVLLQKEFSSSSVEAIAKSLSLPTHTINPLSEEWDKELLATAKAIFN